LDVISKGLRYKGKNIPKGKKIKNVPNGLAKSWCEMGLAKPVNKDGYETATKPAVEKRTPKKDDDETDKLVLNSLKQKDGGWYIFPDGSTAHGKKKALKKLKEWNKKG
jgi:uncharacterized protein YaiL (DUF2058 family)